MPLTEEEKKALEEAKKKIDEILEKDKLIKKEYGQGFDDYGSRDRREW